MIVLDCMKQVRNNAFFYFLIEWTVRGINISIIIPIKRVNKIMSLFLMDYKI